MITAPVIATLVGVALVALLMLRAGQDRPRPRLQTARPDGRSLTEGLLHALLSDHGFLRSDTRVADSQGASLVVERDGVGRFVLVPLRALDLPSDQVTIRAVADRTPRKGTTLVIVGGGRSDAPSLLASAFPLRAIHLSSDGALREARARFRSQAPRLVLSHAFDTIEADLADGFFPRLDAEIARSLAVPVDTESRPAGMPPKGPATKALTLALFLCLAAQVSVSRDALGGDGAAIAVAYGLGAIDREAILGGQWQRLIAAPFLHFGVFHLLMNAWAQWSLGGPIEFLLGSARFLALWTLSALGASLTSLSMNDTSVSAGASGAIFGLLGAFTTFVFLRKDILRQPAPRPLRQGVIATILLNILISFIPNIDVAAHLGGFVTGAICGLFLSRRDPRKPARPGAALMPWFVVPGLVSIGVGVTAIQERASSGLEPPGTFVPYQVGELQLAMPLGFRVSETRSGSTVSLEGEGGAGSPFTVSYKITEPLPTEDAAAAALRDLRKPAPDGPEDSSWIGLARYGVQNGRAIEVVVVAPRSLKREAERLSAEIARRIR